MSNGYTITLDDIVHKNNEPDSQDGSTWLGYMLRNNYLGSSAKAVSHKEIRINNIGVRLIGSQEEPTIKQEIDEAKRQNKIIVEDDDFFVYTGIQLITLDRDSRTTYSGRVLIFCQNNFLIKNASRKSLFECNPGTVQHALRPFAYGGIGKKRSRWF